MNIVDIRFRHEDGKVVLQVKAHRETYSAYHGHGDSAQWRDATMEDLLDVAACLREKYATVEIRHVAAYNNYQPGGIADMPG